MQRALGLPESDPRIEAWTDADYMRQAAMLDLEGEDLDDPSRPDGSGPTQAQMDAQFDEDVQALARGDYAAVDLDPPDFVPASLETFMDRT